MALLRRRMTQRTKTSWGVQELGQFPGFKNVLDLGDESGDGLPPFKVLLCHFQEVQELFADQITHRVLFAEASLDISSCLAPVLDHLVGSLQLRVPLGFPN